MLLCGKLAGIHTDLHHQKGKNTSAFIFYISSCHTVAQIIIMTGPVPSTRESRPMICVFPWPSEINYINFYNEQQQGAKQQALHLDTFNFLAQMIWCPVTSGLAKRFFFLLFLTIFVLSEHITRLLIGSVTISQKKNKNNNNKNTIEITMFLLLLLPLQLFALFMVPPIP